MQGEIFHVSAPILEITPLKSVSVELNLVCHPCILPRIKVRLTHEGERESYSGVHVSARDAAGDDGAEGHSDAPAPIDREEFAKERVSVELTGEGDLRCETGRFTLQGASKVILSLFCNTDSFSVISPSS